MGYSLAASQRQVQKMSPQQFQAASILQSTVQELRAELRRQQDMNPAIEDVKWNEEPILSSVVGGPDDTMRDDMLGTLQSTSSDDHDDRRLERIRTEYSKWDADREERRQHLFDSAVAAETLEDHLQKQIALSDFTPHEREIAEAIIGNLDDSGYFTGSLPDMTMSLGASASDILSVQRKICATFDPPGIAARNLQECLLAQMDLFDDSPWEDEIREIVEKHLHELVEGHGENVRKTLKLTPEEWRRLLLEFKRFNRKPALAFRGDAGVGRLIDPDAPQYIYPEVHAVKRNGSWRAVVTDGALPKIMISEEYRRMADDADASSEARSLAKGYIAKAEELEDMLDDRQERLRSVAQAIIDAQPGFFEKGLAGLAPLTMSAVAEKTKLDESLVSRAVKGKYMTTPFGLMELRRFFVAGMATANGGAMTPTQIVERMKALIDAEDKAHPLSDDALAEALTAEGIPIRRRTVAKYREGAGIATSAKRKCGRRRTSAFDLQLHGNGAVVDERHLHIRAETACSDSLCAEAGAKVRDDALIEGLCDVRTSGGTEAGTAAMRGVGIERELRNDDDAAGDIFERKVHQPLVVLE